MQSKLQLQEGYVIPEMSPNMYWAASEPVLTMNYGSTARGGVAPPRRVESKSTHRREQNTTVEDAQNSTHKRDQGALRQAPLAERPEDAKLNGQSRSARTDSIAAQGAGYIFILFELTRKFGVKKPPKFQSTNFSI